MNKKLLTLMLMVVGLEVIAQTPLYHFNFDNTLYDTSNAVTFVINPGVVSTTLPTYLSGENSGSMGLQVTGSYNVQANLSNLPQGNAARTIMMRVRSFPTSSAVNPLWNYGSSSDLQGLGLKHDNISGSTLTTFAFGTGNETSISNSGIDSASSNWYLLTVTYDGTTLKTYKNSMLLYSQTISLNTNGTLLKLGQFLNENTTVSSVGFRVDDLKIYDTALNIQQIGNQYAYGADLNNGLLAFYDFEDNLDSSTGNHNLTPYGTVNYGTGVEGGTSKCANFTGSSAAYNTSLDTALSNQIFTIVFWEYRPSGTYSAYDTSYEAFGSNYFRVRQGTIRVGAAYNSTSYFSEIDVQNPSFVGVWKHYAVVFKKLASSTVIYLYENGVYKTSTSITTAGDLYKFNNKFTIGGGTDATGNFLSSKFAHSNIDKFFVYNRELTVQEINLLKDQHQAFLLVNNFNQNNLEVALYPNPVRDILNVEIENEIKSVEIYNIHGQKVISSNQKQINVSDLASGMYLVRIQDVDNNIATEKIVIK